MVSTTITERDLPSPSTSRARNRKCGRPSSGLDRDATVLAGDQFVCIDFVCIDEREHGLARAQNAGPACRCGGMPGSPGEYSMMIGGRMCLCDDTTIGYSPDRRSEPRINALTARCRRSRHQGPRRR